MQIMFRAKMRMNRMKLRVCASETEVRFYIRVRSEVMKR